MLFRGQLRYYARGDRKRCRRGAVLFTVHGCATPARQQPGPPAVLEPTCACFADMRLSWRRSLIARLVVVAACAAAGPLFVKPTDTHPPVAMRLALASALSSCHAPAAGADDASALIGHLAGAGQLGPVTGLKVAVCADGEWALVTMSATQARGPAQRLYARIPDGGWTDAGDCPAMPAALARAWHLGCA